VFQIASRFFRQRNQVEDIAQEVFLKAHSQLATYTGRGSFQGWLTRITTNTCLNELRRIKRRPETTIADLTEDENAWLDSKSASLSSDRRLEPERSVIAADLAEKLLGRLPPEDRLVLTLVDGEELSTREVAEMTGWSESKVKVRAFRARSKLRKAVESLMNEKRD
jgi:RNA polymerase sigma-70 factor (ECF subfamily)